MARCIHDWEASAGCPYCAIDGYKDTISKLMDDMMEIAGVLETVPEKEAILHEIHLLQAKTECSAIIARHRVYCSREEPLEALKRGEEERERPVFSGMEQWLYKILANHGPCHRDKICKITGKARSTIYTYLKEMETIGAIERFPESATWDPRDLADQKPGRPRVLWRIKET